MAPAVGAHALVLITRDRRIQLPAGGEAVVAAVSHVRGFVLTGRRSQSTSDSLAVLEKQWSRIVHLVVAQPNSPWMDSVTLEALRKRPYARSRFSERSSHRPSGSRRVRCSTNWHRSHSAGGSGSRAAGGRRSAPLTPALPKMSASTMRRPPGPSRGPGCLLLRVLGQGLERSVQGDGIRVRDAISNPII